MFIKNEPIREIFLSGEFLLFLLAQVVLYFLGNENFLAFHSFAEGFAIIICMSIFIVGWNVRRYSITSPVQLISVGFLFVAILDSIHTLTYFGMGVFVFDDPKNPPTQFWIAARLMMALVFLSAPYLYKWKVKYFQVAVTGLILTSLISYSIFEGFFPDCFITGYGLTDFKIYAEWAVIAILVVSGYIYWKHKDLFPYSWSQILVSFSLIIISELFFTIYSDVYDYFNHIGHLFKVSAFYFVYKGILASCLDEPYRLLFTQLEEKSQALLSTNENLEVRISDFAHTLSFYKRALDVSSVIVITDTNGNIEYANDEFVRLSKYSREELIGKNHRVLKSGEHSTEFYKNIWSTLKAGKIWKGEIKNKAKDGSYYWVYSVLVPYRNRSGEIEKFVGIRHDITAEKLRLEGASRVQRLSALGEISAKVIHETMNPLGVIKGNFDLVKKHLESGNYSKVQEYLPKIDASLVRIQEMFSQLKQNITASTNLISQPARKSVSVFELVESSINFFQSDNRYNDTSILITNSTERAHFAMANGPQIIQVLVNLLANSYDAIRKSNQRWIKISSEESGSNIIIHFVDSGDGIPPEVADMIFNNFFTTKVISGGTGLGLGICREIIKAHGGTIELNRSNSNTEFVIVLPKAIPEKKGA